MAVTLLGTGSPIEIDRFGPSILVQAGGHTLIFDVGRLKHFVHESLRCNGSVDEIRQRCRAEGEPGDGRTIYHLKKSHDGPQDLRAR